MNDYYMDDYFVVEAIKAHRPFAFIGHPPEWLIRLWLHYQ